MNGRYCETGNRYFPPSFGRLPGRLERAARLVRSQRERTENLDSGAGDASAEAA